mgnify:FL=1
MRDFRKYEAWQLSHKLVLEIYLLTKDFPVEEKFGLTSQIRRSSSSIPTNFAEGSSKISEKDFTRFIDIALGSATEVDYQLELSKDLKYISEEKYLTLNNKIISIKKMLFALRQKILIDINNNKTQ